jgi:hypothetical protein
MASDNRKTESARQRILDYFISRGPGVVIDKAELIEVAKISDWARRVRELRDELGWKISSFNDRDDLRPGQYVLESLDQAPASPRRIPSDQRARILHRDGFTCQVCGLGAGEVNPDTRRPVRLHVGHAVAISAGGDNSDDNLRTLCDQCTQGRANLFQPDDRSINALAMIRRLPRDVQLEIHLFLKNKFERNSSQRLRK